MNVLAPAIAPGHTNMRDTEIGPIPDDWMVVELGEIGSFKNGINKDSTAFGHGSPFVNLMDVFGISSIGSSEHLGLIASTPSEQAFYDLHAGDVLFVRSSVKPSGVALTTAVVKDLEKTVFSGFLIRFRDNSELAEGFKRHCFGSEYFRRAAIAASSVSANTNISQSALKSLKLAVPSTKAEQEAIAEALSAADALIESLESLIAKKRAIKQGAMRELLSGQRRLAGFSGEWHEKAIGELANLDPENLGSQTSSDYAFNYIALEDVQEGSLCGFSERKFSSAPSRARRRLKCGDVLVATVRPNLKSHLLFSIAGGEWVCSTGFSVVRCRPEVAVSGFIFAHLFGDIISRQIEMLISGSNYPAINSRDVAALRISCPPLNEQNAISAVLSEMDQELEALAERLAKARQIKQGMMQDLLTGKVRLV